MSIIQKYDVIVIGGGPAGMMSAGFSAQNGKHVLLIEKNKNLGKKLSITGGGRCNIFNDEEDVQKLLSNYGDVAKYLHSPFSQFGLKETKLFFDKLNLPIVVEARKRAFPISQSAPDVTNTMQKFIKKHNVEIKLNTKVIDFITKENRIVGVKTKGATYSAESYVIATGGLSYSQTGSTGDGMNWLKKLGHTVHQSNPNIVPITVKEDWVKKLSGTTLSFMRITFGSDLTKKAGRFSKTGKILFTHFGVSGPLILNSAHEVKRLLAKQNVKAVIDMYPDTEVGTLRNRVLEIFNKNTNKTLKNLLKEFVPKGMHDGVAEQLSIDLQNKKIHSVSKQERLDLVSVLKAMPLTITGTMGMDWAVISDGGVDLKEVNTKTMQSKIHDNLFLIGDVLHVNRPSGGFSLQLCWTTGYVAGTHC